MSKFTKALIDSALSPQEKMKAFFQKDMGRDNARKYYRGMWMLYEKQQLEKANELVEEFTEIEKDEVSFNADKSRTVKRDIELTEEEAQSPEQIMRKMGFDPLNWQVVSCKVVRGRWDVTMKVSVPDGEDVVVKTTSAEKRTNYKYSVTLTVKPLQKKITSEMVEAVFKEIELPNVQQKKYDSVGDKMLELPLFDWHVGKYVEPDEFGDNGYNLEIAKEMFEDVILEFIARLERYQIKPRVIVFPVGQDFFHVDNTKNATTAGTPLEYDGGWQKIFATGVDMLVWAVEHLRDIAPVRLMYVPGNHDEMMSYCAIVGLSHVYKNVSGVEVNAGVSPRKYVQFGECLIGYSHGREEGKRITGLMQYEAPDAWASSKYREWHMGDLHHESAKEDNGIIFRRIGAVAPPDMWHSKKGYVATHRKASAFVWDEDDGLEMIIHISY